MLACAGHLALSCQYEVAERHHFHKAFCVSCVKVEKLCNPYPEDMSLSGLSFYTAPNSLEAVERTRGTDRCCCAANIALCLLSGYAPSHLGVQPHFPTVALQGRGAATGRVSNALFRLARHSPYFAQVSFPFLIVCCTNFINLEHPHHSSCVGVHKFLPAVLLEPEFVHDLLLAVVVLWLFSIQWIL